MEIGYATVKEMYERAGSIMLVPTIGSDTLPSFRFLALARTRRVQRSAT